MTSQRCTSKSLIQRNWSRMNSTWKTSLFAAWSVGNLLTLCTSIKGSFGVQSLVLLLYRVDSLLLTMRPAIYRPRFWCDSWPLAIGAYVMITILLLCPNGIGYVRRYKSDYFSAISSVLVALIKLDETKLTSPLFTEQIDSEAHWKNYRVRYSGGWYDDGRVNVSWPFVIQFPSGVAVWLQIGSY